VAPAKEANTEPKDKDTPKNADDEEHHHRCGRGMVHNRAGECVAARRRPNSEATARQYYRMYQGMMGN
jgi:hypothetical protein